MFAERTRTTFLPDTESLYRDGFDKKNKKPTVELGPQVYTDSRDSVYILIITRALSQLQYLVHHS